jgi:hypothetical protein
MQKFVILFVKQTKEKRLKTLLLSQNEKKNYHKFNFHFPIF